MEKKKSLFHPIPEALIRAVEESSCIAIISHVNPDGDAIFSSLALSCILGKLGKEVHLFNDGPFSRKEIMGYAHLFSSSVNEEVKEKHPLVVILDCSTEDRPGMVYQELKGGKTIVIDHHASGRAFYDEELSYIVPLSPSTTLLVDELRIALGVELEKEFAEYLLLGFLTDTGFFHFISDIQAPDSFKKVSSFISTGLNPYELYDRMHDGRKLDDVKLVARILEECEPALGGKVIIAYEKKDSLSSERPGDSVYPALLECEGVKVVVLIKEKENGIEFGFRAKRNANVDVGALASSLSGGGHVLAAGATVENLKSEDAKSFILEKLRPLV